MPHGLFYQQHGPEQQAEHDNSLNPLVLVHGLFGNSDNLSAIRRAFENERQVISIDLPDHGKSLRSEQFSFDEYANKIVELLHSLELSRCILVGHSLGGKVSMLIAKKSPLLIERLIVMDIAPVSYSPRHEDVFKGLSNVDLDTIASRTDAKNQLSAYVKDAGTQAFLLKALYQDDAEKWQWRFNLTLLMRDYALLSGWEFSNLFYEGPTLFIKGSDSDYILSEHQAAILEHFPHAKAKIVQAGHWLHAQKPQVVNALITNFLRVE